MVRLFCFLLGDWQSARQDYVTSCLRSLTQYELDSSKGQVSTARYLLVIEGARRI